MENLRTRALKLADLIASAEPPYSRAVHEATEEIREHIHELDAQTQQEVMERIRGFSD